MRFEAMDRIKQITEGTNVWPKWIEAKIAEAVK
jgi:hypothetical protein